jgi:preprotein translocase subunit YajC
MKSGIKVLISHASRVVRSASSFVFFTILFHSVSVAELWDMSAPGKEGGEAPGGGLTLFMPLILVFLIFYFLLIRPQAKQQKKHQGLLKQLKRGDQIITSSGIHGKITAVTDTTVGVEVAQNVRLTIEKQQVARVMDAGTPETKKS